MCRDWNRAGTLFVIRGCSIGDCLWKRLLGLVGRGIGLVDMLVGVWDGTCDNGMPRTNLVFHREMRMQSDFLTMFLCLRDS